MTQREAVIVEAVRTAVGRRGGQLKDWHPVDLLAQTLSALVQRTNIDAGLVEDVIIGCVSQVGEQSLNVGRNAVLAAGFPETVPGTTVDRQCGSSQQAIHFAAQGVLMMRFLKNPIDKALFYSGFGIPLYVSGMLVSAFAARLFPGG